MSERPDWESSLWPNLRALFNRTIEEARQHGRKEGAGTLVPALARAGYEAGRLGELIDIARAGGLNPDFLDALQSAAANLWKAESEK